MHRPLAPLPPAPRDDAGAWPNDVLLLDARRGAARALLATLGIATLAIVTLASCAPEAPEDPTVALERAGVESAAIGGVVIDGLTERPVEGVRVRARDAAPSGAAVTFSDERGRFSLRVPRGSHRLWLDRDGYADAQRANVVAAHVAGSAPATPIVARVFPTAPPDSVVRDYFRRQPLRRHAHPAHDRPRGSSFEGGADVGRTRAAGGPTTLPASIRVWRARGTAIEPSRANNFADRSCDAAANILELPLEEYVKGVIPHEWIPSWHPESLIAGAIAARSYASNWAQRGGRWDCADVDDGTVTQVYSDDRAASTDAAVEASRGQVVVRAGDVISAEYSAENGDPTEFGADEPTCAGETRNGHGRGMCQWGSHRWASAICANPPCSFGGFGQTARDHRWMVEHYYPGASVFGDGTPAEPCAIVPASGGVVDDTGPCFTAFGPPQFWRTESLGYGGSLRWTNAFEASSPSNWARWTLHFAQPGRYAVEAFIDDTWGRHTTARYEIAHRGGPTTVVIDQGVVGGWAQLGEFDFDAEASVSLYDNESYAVPPEQHLAADALRLTPAGVAPGRDAGATPPGRDGGSILPGADAGAQPVRDDGGAELLDGGPGSDGPPGRGDPLAGGCGCRAATEGRARWGAFSLVGLAALAALRRRRRRPS